MSSLGAEVGSGHVSIFPTMQGFRSKVTAEVRGTATESGSIFKRLFKRSGDESGKQLGRGVKEALEQSVRALKVPALSKLQDDLAKVRREGTTTYDRMREASARADAAQAKYNETVQKYGADSTQAKTAQVALITAQDRAKEASDKYATSQEKLKAVQEQVNAAEKLYKPAQYEHAAAQVKTLTAAKEAEQKVYDRASKVEQKAQEALSKAIQKHGADSKQAQRAQENLSKAMLASRPAAEALKNVTDKLSDAQKQLDKVSKDYKPVDTGKSVSAFARLRDAIRQTAGQKLTALREEMRKTSDSGQSLSSRIKAGTVALGTVIGNAVSNAASKVKDFAQDCMSEYNEASEIVAKFNNVAENNHWSKAQTEALSEYADKLKETGVVDDDVTRAGMAQLGTFKLTASQIKTLTPALDEMLAHQKGVNATTQDAVGIGNLMGKVMTGSTSALSRYGVTLTKAQKETLEHGNAMKKASTLAEVLSANFGHANEKLAQTPVGKMQQFKMAVDDMKKSLGGSFSTVLLAVAPTIQAGLDKAQKPVENFAQWFKTAIKGITDSLRTGNISAEMQKAFGVNAGPILDGLKGVRDGFKAIWDGITRGAGTAGKSLGGIRDHVSPLAALFQALGGIARSAGQALGKAFSSQSLRSALGNIAKSFNQLVSVLPKILTSLAPVALKFASVAAAGAKFIASIPPKTLSAIAVALLSIAGGAKALGPITGLIGGVSNAFGHLHNAGKKLGEFGKSVGKDLGTAGKAIGSFGKTVGSGIGKAASAIGRGTVTAAKAVGSFSKTIATGIGKGVSTAAKAVGSFGKTIGSGIAKGVSTGAKAIGSFSKVIGSGIVKGVSTAGKAIGSFGKVVGSGLVKALSAAGRAFSALGATLAANPWMIVAAAIAAVVTALVLFFTKTKAGRKIAHDIGQWFVNAWKGIQKAWNGAVKFFQGLWKGIVNGAKGLVHGIGKHFQDAWKGAQKAWHGAQKWATKTGKDIAKGFQNMKKDVSKHFSDAKKGAQNAWKGMNKWASSTGKNIATGFQNVKKGISDHFRKANEGAQKIWRNTPSWFKNSIAGRIISGYASMPGKITGFFRNPAQSARNIWNGVKNWFQSVPRNIVGFFRSLPNNIHRFFKSAGDKVQNVWKGVTNFFKSIPSRIVGFFKRLPGDMLQIGKNIINGIINGIKSNIGHVAQVITGGMKSAIDNVKHFLGIHSPSTVMRDQVGQFIGLGLASGIRQSMPAVSDAMTEMAGIPANTRMSMPSVRGGSLASAAVAAGQMPVTRDDILRLTDAVESLHRDLGPTISRWTPTLSGRERARVVRDALAGRY